MSSSQSVWDDMDLKEAKKTNVGGYFDISQYEYDKTQGFLKQNALFTGSRAFGVHDENSDIDYVLTSTSVKGNDLLNEILDGAVDYAKSASDGGHKFYSLKLKTVNRPLLNAIVIHPDDYTAWHVATSIMMSICKNIEVRNLILLKENRVELFTTLKLMARNRLTT